MGLAYYVFFFLSDNLKKWIPKSQIIHTYLSPPLAGYHRIVPEAQPIGSKIHIAITSPSQRDGLSLSKPTFIWTHPSCRACPENRETAYNYGQSLQDWWAVSTHSIATDRQSLTGLFPAPIVYPITIENHHGIGLLRIFSFQTTLKNEFPYHK